MSQPQQQQQQTAVDGRQHNTIPAAAQQTIETADDVSLSPTPRPERERTAVQQANLTGSDSRNITDTRRRLMRDLAYLRQNPNERFSASPINGDLMHWRAVIMGPDNSVWEGGVFKLRLDFTDEYPNAPPSVRFVTPNMFHPNIYVNGHICLDTLKAHWSATLNVESLLIMIVSLLSDPNPLSAANGEAAQLLVEFRERYERRVEQLVEDSLEQEFTDEDEDDQK